MASPEISSPCYPTDKKRALGQRDSLKSAADAAAVAATLEMLDLPSSMSDDEVEAALQPTAERYVRFNLASSLSQSAREKMEETLVVTLDADQATGIVDVMAQADLGGTLLSRWFLAYAGPPDGIAVDAGVGASISATELVFAIDVTVSMIDDLDGVRVPSDDPSSRINIVRKAARDLVDILAARENSTIAVGLVPWSYRVRLDAATRSSWETKGWATYPASRTYPHPTRGPGASRYLPEQQTLPEQTELPTSCRAWAGCLDKRSSLFSTALPADDPFVMNFFTTQTTYPEDQYVSYACQDYTRVEARSHRPRWEIPVCYDLDRAPNRWSMCRSGDIQTDGPRRLSPQDRCDGPAVMPLTTELADARAAINALRSSGSATYSSVGLTWAMRLLSPAWRSVWGHSEHPMDADADVQKIIVLLTDGEDNHFRDAFSHRSEGCTAAKQEGILIFTIAAMNPENISQRLGRQLTECSSQSDYPNRKYAFVNNATPAALEEAFAEIGRQIMSLRRTH